MPGVQTYYLRGGPCDGKTGALTPNQPAPGHIDCSGHRYTEDAAAPRVNGALVYNDAGPVPKPADGGVEPHAHTAWHDLQRSINKRWPDAVTAASAQRKAALRSLARASRVRV